jgi:hypothetical protein
LSLLFFEFSVLFVNPLLLHVNDADLLVNQDILGRASDNRRYARVCVRRAGRRCGAGMVVLFGSRRPGKGG